MQVSFDRDEFKLLEAYVRDIERSLEAMSYDKYSLPTCASEIELYLNQTSEASVAGDIYDIVAALEGIRRILTS